MNFDEIIIECSPFMSSIQTAGLIAEMIGAQNIEINFLLGNY
jgi:hypothetical protein